ncbi:hypothetical protein [Roseibium sp. SCP14]|uniref:hypothetical protein n=1 Tax=Roseibium sp. SCP14 TaxID=3141375 RepID=UPI00333E07C0
MLRLFAACMLIVLGFSAFAPAQAEFPIPARIVTLKPHGQEDGRYRYVEILLEKILGKAGSQAKVAQAQTRYSRDRLLQELIKGENIHVIAEAPKPGWEEQLLPIRIPIRKGLQGYRLFLINRQDQAALANVNSLEELQDFATGSGAQWSTRSVMEQAGFQVVTSEDYEALFKMLKLRRFVTFGRGINEVFKEQESFAGGNGDLIVEKTLCLFIPLPTYFFVSPAHPELAKLIELGLKQMIADGSFDQHFLTFHHADLSRANLSKRKIFSISNPNLSGQTPIGEPSYWLDPASLGDLQQENDS